MKHLYQLRLTTDHGIDLATMLQEAVREYRKAQSDGKAVAQSLVIFSDGFGLGPILSEMLVRGEIPAYRSGLGLTLFLSEADKIMYTVRMHSLPDVVGRAQLHPEPLNVSNRIVGWLKKQLDSQSLIRI